jgi:hypothetical protein
MHPFSPTKTSKHYAALFAIGALILAMDLDVQSQERVPDVPDRSVFMTSHMPYAAFDQLPQHVIEVGRAKLKIAFVPGALDLNQATFIAWVERSAHVIAKYYGRFPVDDARILIIPVGGDGVRNGTSFGYRGAALKVTIGKGTSREQLDDDWVLIHEMVHFAFPDTDDDHLWFSEGQATYVENIARVQAGVRELDEAWQEIVSNMPKGLPQPGDEGLDRTHTWGRTYWGGALFCLVADIEIHKRTENRFGLREALRAVVNAGGVTTEHWPLEKALKIGDEAVGVNVLEEMYARLKASPGNTDLKKLWSELGVGKSGSEVTFDDHAPLAKVRVALTMPEKSK